MKLKMHHILLLVCLFFISGMLITTLIKESLQERQKLKSEVRLEDLKIMVESEAKAYAETLNSEVDLDSVTYANFFFFKNKRELEVLLNNNKRNFLLKLNFKNLSPGYGLREKLIEVTPSEGIYYVETPGYVKTSGYFVKVDYPPKFFKDYQKLDYDNLINETYIIGEKAIGDSFIQTEPDFMKLFIYLILKLPKDKLKLLIYPDRPPLTMELGGTEFTSEVYKRLDDEYKELNLIYESLKPKY